jgi:Ala-tRNA(Pro) deacylase
MNNYHSAVEKIKDILNKKGFWFEIFEHEPVTTSEEAANIRTGYELHQGTKALIVKAKVNQKEKKFIMVIVPGDKKFDTSKLKDVFGISDVRFATESEVSEITSGVQRGGVPPFGNLFNLITYVDTSVFTNKKIIFNAGDRSVSISMYSQDYKNIFPMHLGDII